MRRQWLFATVASTALILTGCSPDALDSGDSADNVTAIATSLSPPAAADAPLLKTADSPLGTIAVDGEGMTVYVYNPDEENSQAGSCDESVPALLAGGHLGHGFADRRRNRRRHRHCRRA